MSVEGGGARWRQVDALFAEALDVPARERASWLADRCGEDEELLREVSGLLAAADTPGFLETRAGDVVAEALSGALEDSGGDRRGEQVGPFRLIERIGRGGMADVYLAEREGDFEQRVAVKIQRRGIDTEDVLARFRAERQILSGLEHPNIARLIDGGATPDGLPYLVMEYVDGTSITKYCEENRLPVRDRLRLFDQAARAVQAAHARLIVHRDIKPSNVLVTSEGRVKLLDFGIAKLLDPTTMPGAAPKTRTGHRPLTPEYASPEQVRGDPITTASDIYQLGLLLYEILTGGRPFQDRGRSGRALEDAITDARPSRPSDFVEAHENTVPAGVEVPQLARRLRGDLDTIVLTALQKDPERRHPSAFELAEDVRRHLEGRPIWARQDSAVYRTRKFLQRNIWVAPVALALLAGTGLYIATLVRHGRQMEAERNAARLETEKAREAQEFLVGLFRSADPFLGTEGTGRDVMVRDVMDRGVERSLTELEDRPDLQIMMLGTIGEVFLALGDAEKATTVRQAALDRATRSFGPESPEAARAAVALIEPTIRNERRGSGTAHGSVGVALAGLTAARQTFGYDHIEALRAQVVVASLLKLNGNHTATIILLEHALPLIRQSPDASVDDLAEALRQLDSVLLATHQLGRLPEGKFTREYASELVHLLEREYGTEHVRTAWVRFVAADRLSPDDARRERQTAIPILRERLGDDHDRLARAYILHGNMFRSDEQYDSAAANFRAAADVWARSGDEPVWQSIALTSLAATLLRLDRPDDASDVYGEAIAAVPAAEEGDSRAGATRERRLSFIRLNKTWADYRAGQPASLLLPGAQSLVRYFEGQPALAFAACLAGLLSRDLGRHVEAELLAARAAAIREASEVPDTHEPALDPCDVLLPTAAGEAQPESAGE